MGLSLIWVLLGASDMPVKIQKLQVWPHLQTPATAGRYSLLQSHLPESVRAFCRRRRIDTAEGFGVGQNTIHGALPNC